MRGRHRKARTEAERHDFRLESSKMSHAKARWIEWGEQHKSPPRTSAMPPPSLDTLRDAYQRRNESCESMIRLGSMLEDIEAAHGIGYKFEKFDDSGTADSFFIDYDTLGYTVELTTSDVPVFPVNYDNCHLMNARNEALCRKATGVEATVCECAQKLLDGCSGRC